MAELLNAVNTARPALPRKTADAAIADLGQYRNPCCYYLHNKMCIICTAYEDETFSIRVCGEDDPKNGYEATGITSEAFGISFVGLLKGLAGEEGAACKICMVDGKLLFVLGRQDPMTEKLTAIIGKVELTKSDAVESLTTFAEWSVDYLLRNKLSASGSKRKAFEKLLSAMVQLRSA